MPKRFNKSPMTRIQVADDIGISTSTLKRQLEKANINLPSGLIYRSDLNKIEKHFYPDESDNDLEKK